LVGVSKPDLGRGFKTWPLGDTHDAPRKDSWEAGALRASNEEGAESGAEWLMKTVGKVLSVFPLFPYCPEKSLCPLCGIIHKSVGDYCVSWVEEGVCGTTEGSPYDLLDPGLEEDIKDSFPGAVGLRVGNFGGDAMEGDKKELITDDRGVGERGSGAEGCVVDNFVFEELDTFQRAGESGTEKCRTANYSDLDLGDAHLEVSYLGWEIIRVGEIRKGISLSD
jgi:hypothetical protein